MLYALAVTLTFHVGGIPTAANFQNPNQLGVLADQSFDFTWIDNEQDMTGKFDFFYQASNVHPLAPVGSPEFVGQMVPGAQQVPISDAANHYLWDTSGVPSGSYYLYEITADAPLPPISGISLAPVTIQHAGDPLWPAVLVSEPDGIGDIVEDEFAIKWIATGEGQGMRARISYRNPDAPDPSMIEIVSDVPTGSQGGGSYAGCYLWDLGLMPEGSYYVQVEVTDDAGNKHASYSNNNVRVYRNPSNDAGVPQACENMTPMPDAGGSGDGGGGGGGGCAVAGSRAPAGALSGGLLLAALAVTATRRRRARAR